MSVVALVIAPLLVIPASVESASVDTEEVELFADAEETAFNENDATYEVSNTDLEGTETENSKE
jgi:phage major head subunit gpT-like protein